MMPKCGRKTKFPTAYHARRSMKSMIAKRGLIGDFRPYSCSECGSWHWGRRNGRFDKAQQVINAIDKAISKDRATHEQKRGS